VTLEAIRGRPVGVDSRQMLVVSAFLGKVFYKTAIKALGDYIDKVNPRMKTYPHQGPRSEFIAKLNPAKQTTTQQHRAEKLKELNEIADKAAGQKRELAVATRLKSQDLDCYLYVQDDEYR